MDKLIKELIKFRNSRGWEDQHTKENLAKSIMIEAAELLENYQWGKQSHNLDNVRDEIADVLIYTLTLAYEYGFDIEEIIRYKMYKNGRKYPMVKRVEGYKGALGNRHINKNYERED